MVAPNDILGYYRLIERIGAGGMGEVWKAEDTRLGRIVAIKILPSQVAADQEATARMRREARNAAQHNHPNIATIHSFEEIGEQLFIVMEYVEGEPFSKLIARGPLAEAEACRIGRAVAEALAEAHSKGIIHRDIKPDNIIVSGNRVKVLDFGIAKQVGVQSGANDPTAFLTQQGVIIGTVHYMSPEQALGKSLDPRTDIFSLGVVLYQALTGKLPFAGETVTETITRIVRDEPQPPSRVNPAVSREMAAIVTRCLRKNKAERYATAGDLATALDAQMTRATTAPMKTATVSAPPPKPEKKRRALIPMLIGAMTITLALFVVFNNRVGAPAPGRPTVAEAATATLDASTAATIEPAPPPAATASASAPIPPPKQAPAPPTADELFAKGLRDLLARRPNEARREFAAAFAADPRHKKAHLGIAIVNGQWERARKIANQIHQENPNDADLQTLRGFLQEVEQRQEQRPVRPRRRLRP